MTTLDFDAIKARAELFAATPYGAGIEVLMTNCMAVTADVPALVAEVERLRDLLDRNHRAYLEIQGIDPDKVATRESSDSSSTGSER